MIAPCPGSLPNSKFCQYQKKTLEKKEIKLFPLSANSHENKSQSQIFCELLQSITHSQKISTNDQALKIYFLQTPRKIYPLHVFPLKFSLTLKKCLSVSNHLKHATLHCHSSPLKRLLTTAYVNCSPAHPHSLSHTQNVSPLTLRHLHKIATHPVFPRINMDPISILSVTKNVPRNLFCIHNSMPCP